MRNGRASPIRERDATDDEPQVNWKYADDLSTERRTSTQLGPLVNQSISKILTKRCTRRVVSKDLNHSQGR